MTTTSTTGTVTAEGERGVPLESATRALASSRGLSINALAPIDRLRIRTRNSWYDIMVVGPAESSIVIQGGAFFPDPCRARLAGASLGGSMLRLAWVGVGLCLEICHQGRRIVTTPVREIRTTAAEGRLAGPY
jgi:hypothetical protein